MTSDVKVTVNQSTIAARAMVNKARDTLYDCSEEEFKCNVLAAIEVLIEGMEMLNSRSYTGVKGSYERSKAYERIKG